MKSVLFVPVMLLFSFLLQAGDFFLVENGKPAAVIRFATPSTPMAEADVRLFNEELKKVTGVTLPVVRGKQSGNEILIVLKKLPYVENDRYTMDFPEADTLRITCSEYGLFHALLRILEKHAGVFYLGLYEADYPHLRELKVPREKVVWAPAMNINRYCGDNGLPITMILQRAAMIKPKSTTLFGPECLPVLKKSFFAHTLTRIPFPVEEYYHGEKWPQEVLPLIRGKRIPPPKNQDDPNFWFWQVCFSSPESVKIGARNALKFLEKHPEVQGFLSLSQNDLGKMCECEKCLAQTRGARFMGFKDYSEPYWHWVNEVAKIVTARYPKIVIFASAYRETGHTPPFKLLPNVVPVLCFESWSALNFPSWGRERFQLTDEWSKKAVCLGHHDYNSGCWFLVPFLFLKKNAEFYREMYRKGMRYAEVEGTWFLPQTDGPKAMYLCKLFADLNLDADQYMKDWCTHSVGEKAAPYLIEYYRNFEKFWDSEALRQTPFFKAGPGFVYINGLDHTYVYALEKGFSARQMELMKQVVSHAETKDQKRRAATQMEYAQNTKDILDASLGEYIRPDGSFGNAGEVSAFLDALPSAYEAADRVVNRPNYKSYHNQNAKPHDIILKTLSLLSPWIGDASVRAKMHEVSMNPKIPSSTSQLLLALSKADRMKDILGWGDFENLDTVTRELPEVKHPLLTDRKAKSGKYAMGGTPEDMFFVTVPVKPGKFYRITGSYFVPERSDEGRIDVSCSLFDAAGKRIGSPDSTPLPSDAGKWLNFSVPVIVPPNRGGKVPARLQVVMRWIKFESDKTVYWDDIKVMEAVE